MESPPPAALDLQDIASCMKLGPSHALRHLESHENKAANQSTGTIEQLLTGYPTAAILEVNNATEFVMMSPMANVNRGETSNVPLFVSSGYQELILAHRTGSTFSGTFGSVSWVIDSLHSNGFLTGRPIPGGPRQVVLMWYVPYSDDNSCNVLSIGLTPTATQQQQQQQQQQKQEQHTGENRTAPISCPDHNPRWSHIMYNNTPTSDLNYVTQEYPPRFAAIGGSINLRNDVTPEYFAMPIGPYIELSDDVITLRASMSCDQRAAVRLVVSAVDPGYVCESWKTRQSSAKNK